MFVINWSEVFDEIDTNGNGKIEYQEFFDHFKNMFPSVSKEVVEKDLKSFDLNNDGVVIKEEFIKLMSQNALKDPEDIKNAFKKFDVDKSGYLTTEELNEAMKTLCMDISGADTQAIIKSAIKDGKIDYKEFIDIAMNL
ncbi:calmodulin-alpha-like isoform X1 [Octopus vulgaris]|uniref:Calmodulin-alpha-like isoform X1 n=1 Tax=Octopus vulgaris TaxID=6645 RepID=A0AA36AFI0_OCTVU|nr:calmodulin-alpha-like isoform X1 [Octopus vulgaris]